MLNFSGRFIPILADIATPLQNLLTKNAKFNWTHDCEQAFEQLKHLVKKSVMLHYPDYSKPFLLRTDASNLGLGAVLLQEDSESRLVPICFISRSLTKSEQNYSTTEKELLAIVWSLQKLHAYVHGSQLVIETDHQPLSSLIKKQHPPGRLLRWVLALQDYEFDISYLKGKDNGIADSLSRIVHVQNMQMMDVSLLNLAQLQDQDPHIIKLKNILRQGNNVREIRRFLIKDNVLCFSSGDLLRPYIPNTLTRHFVEYFHSHPLFGHLGFHKCLNLL